MVKEILLEEIRKAMKELISKNGEFALVMLIPFTPESLESDYNLIVSAPWLDEQSPKQGLLLIRKTLMKHLSEEQLKLISQVTCVRTTDKTVKALNSAFHIPMDGGLADITNTNLFGVYIEKAFLIVSQRLEKIGAVS